MLRTDSKYKNRWITLDLAHLDKMDASTIWRQINATLHTKESAKVLTLPIHNGGNLCEGRDCSLTTQYMESPSNITNQSEILNQDVHYNWMVLFLGILVIAGMLGNILVIVAVSVEQKLHNVTNYFLLSLAVADLLVSVIVMPLAMMQLFLGSWTLGIVLCDIYVTCDVLMCSSSIIHMCTISLDRYLGIRHPLRYRSKSRSYVCVKIIIVWFISFVVCCPITVLGIAHHEHILQDKFCSIQNKPFMLYGSIAAFFIPLVIMVVTYILTVKLLQKQVQMYKRKSKEGQVLIRRSGAKPKRRFRKPPIDVCRPICTNEKEATGYRNGNLGNYNNNQGSSNITLNDHHQHPFLHQIDNHTHQLTAQLHYSSSGTESKDSSPPTPPPPSPFNQRPRSMGMFEKGSSSQDVNNLSHSDNINGVLPHRARAHTVSHEPSNFDAITTEEDASNRGSSNSVDSGQSPFRNGTSSRRARDLWHKPSMALRAANIMINHRREKVKTVRTEQKASKVLGIVFVVFVVCWAPFFITNFMTPLCKACHFSENLITVFVWLGYASSILNPLIYTVFNKTFKDTFVDLLLCRYSKKHKLSKLYSLSFLNAHAAAWAGRSIPSSYKKKLSLRKSKEASTVTTNI
ncbi:5-hydroxytryptamine receptor 2C [Lingula anatina]|uniref:5-hydroxytryptamine receptor 2C n=1 Tax=Lingula anatina TaxID=7574 RepID=A0A1S3K4R4_LINAN|nr:5-hydroxytryptamine receptor 2C [Lingula anatina]XP_013417409.1 5-hydroxytryptamine receptor 2C [Lingula anatina]XP_013417410.1 5-hydroxytryptamine receptor 2C [Lingula anatina]XP_023932205.1 5-hydroxytryptamine receptor 2C [Lingula anatina]|eukprot:XP_013417405.1 5-hydroxytryptamine receptor 2C [Lingula anatina]